MVLSLQLERQLGSEAGLVLSQRTKPPSTRRDRPQLQLQRDRCPLLASVSIWTHVHVCMYMHVSLQGVVSGPVKVNGHWIKSWALSAHPSFYILQPLLSISGWGCCLYLYLDGDAAFTCQASYQAASLLTSCCAWPSSRDDRHVHIPANVFFPPATDLPVLQPSCHENYPRIPSFFSLSKLLFRRKLMSFFAFSKIAAWRAGRLMPVCYYFGSNQ